MQQLSDDPAQWQDRSVLLGRRLWQSTRNPLAFSEDGGRSFFLLPERCAAHPDPPPYYLTAVSGCADAVIVRIDELRARRDSRKALR